MSRLINVEYRLRCDVPLPMLPVRCWFPWVMIAASSVRFVVCVWCGLVSDVSTNLGQLSKPRRWLVEKHDVYSSFCRNGDDTYLNTGSRPIRGKDEVERHGVIVFRLTLSAPEDRKYPMLMIHSFYQPVCLIAGDFAIQYGARRRWDSLPFFLAHTTGILLIVVRVR